MATHIQDSTEETLVQICQTGDIKTLETLLTQNPGININITTEGGVTLLMHAIIGAGTNANPDGHYLAVCQLLVESGVYLETADLTYGRTAAHWAVYYHREDILTELIIAGCDMTMPDFSGMSPFNLAIEENVMKCITEALRFLPKEILDFPDSQNRVPLVHAIQSSNFQACQILIQGESDLSYSDPTTGKTPLHYAAEMRNAAIIELLLHSGAHLDVLDMNGLTPVHTAAIIEGQEALSAIAKVVGSDVLNLPDARGLTPLMHACTYGNETSVKFLLKRKANALAQDLEGKTCLHWAAESVYPLAPNCVQILCKKYRDLIEIKDSYQRSPLHLCAIGGSTETLQVLLSNGADIASMDDEQHTAVHWATVNGNSAVLVAMIDAGCPVSTTDIHGAYPLHYAAQQAREPLATELYSEQDQLHSLNVLECLRILLEKGAPVDCTDTQGMQPLHWALQFPNNLKACTLLVAHGADPNAKDNDGLTGLHIAAHQGLAENCQFVLEQTGASHAKEADLLGQTALFHAVESSNIGCVQHLLGMGFFPNHQNNEGRSPAHVSATLGILPCLQLLHAYGADFTLKSIHGATPMHEAAANGHTNALEYLISAGSPVNDPAGPTGATALHYAVSGGHEGCIKVLLHYGAEMNALMTTEEGEQLTALDYCGEHTAIIELLIASRAVTGAELTGITVTEPPTQVSKEQEDQTEPKKQELLAAKEGVGPKDEDQLLTLKQSRPVSPTKQSLQRVVFESEQLPNGKGADHPIAPRRLSRQSLESLPLQQHEDEDVIPRKEAQRKEPFKHHDAFLELRTLPPEKKETPESRQESRQESKPPGLLDRALSVLKRSKPPPPSSILSSAVGFYAAHATMLAAAIIGTPLGETTMEVAKQVASDTAEELKRAEATYEGELLDLVWLHEEEEPREPTPPVIEEPPPPTPSPPPVPEIKEDPYERRLRKAKAQMDMTKSPAYRAMEELLKAQSAHMKLKRQYEEAKLSEDLSEMKEAFHIEEQAAQKASDQTMRRYSDRIRKAELVSEQVNKAIDHQLQHAKAENDKISAIMGSIGVSSRPTVAQWLEKKTEQKRTTIQEDLMNWDRNKQHREAAILLQQAITSQRAMKHAAWGARKEISAKLRALKESEFDADKSEVLTTMKPSKLLHKPQFSRPPSYSKPTIKVGQLKLPKSHLRAKHTSSVSTATSNYNLVRATPQGFLKMRDNTVATPAMKTQWKTATGPNIKSRDRGREEIWKLGESYVQGKFTTFKNRPPSQAFLRAIGPKDVHAERTCTFLPPKEYEAMKVAKRASRNWKSSQDISRNLQNQELATKTVQKRSPIAIKSLDFDTKQIEDRSKELTRSHSYSGSTAVYHSLAGSFHEHGSSQPCRQKPVGVPVFPMNVLDSNNLPAAVMS